MATMAAAAAPSADRLSHLPEDILTHILSFAPSREAARATALSRRWRPALWLNTRAVNVDYRSYAAAGERRRAVDDADHAYAFLCSRGRVPKKLSILMPDDAIVCVAGTDEEDEDETVEDVGRLDEDEDETAEDADGVEEDPRLEWLNNGGLPRCTLPFAVLRVLELTGYNLKPYSDPRRKLAFPRLEAMRLRRCRTEPATLQHMLAASPRLADVRLEALSFVDYHDVYWLSCVAATVFVMENCSVLCEDILRYRGCNIKLDAPRLLHFRYAHDTAFDDYYTSFSGWSVPKQLEKVHVEIHSAVSGAVRLWRSILSGVSHVRRALKLTTYSIADLDIKIEPFFRSLKRLEIEELCGWSVLNHRAAAKAVVRLLRRCPNLVELRFTFSWRKYLQKINMDPADEVAAIADFSPCRSIEGDTDGADCCDALEDLHGKFCCFRTLDRLRRVVLEFDAEELTCFQVRLVKFLAVSAVDLQELVVHGGKGYDSSRIDRKVARWRQLRKMPPPPLWPPPLSEFPPLEAPPRTTSAGEIDDGHMLDMKEDASSRHYYKYSSEEEEEEDDDGISPRHYMHSGRKKKKGGCLGCCSVRPKANALATSGWGRAGATRHCRRRQHYSDWEEESADSSVGSPLADTHVPAPVSTPAEPWSAPLLYEFPPLRRAIPPASRKTAIQCGHHSTTGRLSTPPAGSAPVDLITPPDLPCSASDTFAREWRVVRLSDLGIDVATRQCSRRLPQHLRSTPASFRHRFSTFSGRPSRTMWRR
jgi:hypothetical protein